jgi:hypothetical protein
LFRIWRANQPDSPDNELIDLNEGGDYLLVWRDVDSAEIRQLDVAQFEFLAALGTGACLAEAVLAAERTGTEFDLGLNLEGWVAAGIVVGFSLDVHRG